MKTPIALACVVAIFLGLAFGVTAQELLRPKIIAVQIFAEWCEPCSEMDDIASDLADRFDGEPILGIVLDVTDLSTRYHAELLAGALGLDDLYRKKKGTLGVIYLLDAKTKSIIETITQADEFDTMSEKVQKALANQ